MMKPKVGGQQPFFVIKEGRCFCFGGGGNKNNPQPADRPLKSPDAASVNVPPKTAEVSEKTTVRLGKCELHFDRWLSVIPLAGC